MPKGHFKLRGGNDMPEQDKNYYYKSNKNDGFLFWLMTVATIGLVAIVVLASICS